MKLCTLTAILFLSCSIFGQVTATTEDGRKVILKTDNTWEYAVDKPANEVSAVTDCSLYTQSKTDRMTDRSYVSGKNQIVLSNDGGKTGISILPMFSNGILILAINVAGDNADCIDDEAKINILFQDDTKSVITSSSKFNCLGRVPVRFESQNSLGWLSTKKIKAIRINARKDYIEKDFTDDQAVELMNQINCLKALF